MGEVNCLSKEEAIDCVADLWSLLTEEEQTRFSEHLSVRRFRKSEPIYREGESPDELICLLSGKVKIYRDGVGGRSQIIRVIKPVEYFGYRAYLAGEPYVTGAAAFEASDVCFIPMTIVEETMRHNNALAMFFVRQLAVDLGIADRRTVNLTQKHIRGRLAEALKLYDGAIAAAPDFAEAYRQRGAVKFRLNDRLGAFDDLKKALALRPDLGEAFDGLLSSGRQ